MTKRKMNNSGITLIALVLTIIVLLILAGVSIAMLTGDNSILQKATIAKENTEREEIVEKAKIDVLNEITGNKGNDLQESQLKSVLENYFIKSEIPEELPSDLSTVELTTQNQKYKIKVSEIYNGKLAKAKTSKKLTEIVKNTDYGKSIDYSVTVNGTTLNDWKVFLNDGNNVYVILGNYLPGGLGPDLGGYPVEHWSEGGREIYGVEYESDGDLMGLGESNYFTDFVDNNVAVSATGGPTIEQLEASCGVAELSVRRYLNWRFICDFRKLVVSSRR